jgi:putative transposase
MSRKSRIEFDGAPYHVITRVNKRQQIFGGTEDYDRYLKILGDYKTRYDFVHCVYVLM